MNVWAKLLETLVHGIVRGVLGLKKTDAARQLGEDIGRDIGEDILRRGLHPSELPAQPLPYKEVARQQRMKDSAARPFPPPLVSPTARPPPLPQPASQPPHPPPPHTARSSAAPPPAMPPKRRYPRSD